MKNLTLIAIFCCIHLTLKSQAIIYVDSAATGLNNGQSWTNAFTDLQDALEAAQLFDDIWIAKGTYIPSKDLGDNVPTNLRDCTFETRPAVDLYGGFAGGETNINQRDWRQNKCVLSGKLGSGLRARTVVNCSTITNIDGFFIRHGWGDTAGVMTAGGMIISNSAPRTIRNIELSNNRGGYGALYILTSSVNATFINITCKNNIGKIGGGMTLMNHHWGTFINCRLQNNISTQNGGGLYIEYGNPNLINFLITNNSADWLGDGVYIHDAYPNFINSTIAKNSTLPSQGPYPVTGSAIYTKYYKNSTIRNSIIEGEIAYDSIISRATFYNSMIENSGGSANWDTLIGFDGGNNYDFPAHFLNRKGNDFSLDHCSDGIDNAYTLYLPADEFDLDEDGDSLEWLSLDVLGNQRLQNNGLDMGAIEGFDYDTIAQTVCLATGIQLADSLVKSSGIHTFYIPRSGKCDSVLIYDLKPEVDTAIAIDMNGQSMYVLDSNATYQWYDCTNKKVVGNQNGQRFSPDSIGVYAAIITKNGCSDTSACVNINQVGIEENLTSLQTNIFPNPSGGLFRVQFNRALPQFNWEVMDLSGRKVKSVENISTKDFTIDLSSMVSGVYLLKVYSAEGTMCYKLVKN